jgi:hypothetical protein
MGRRKTVHCGGLREGADYVRVHVHGSTTRKLLMWVFTVDGFYSVFQQTEFCSPDEVVVRSRVREDLERMLARLERVFVDGEVPPSILSFVGTDYAYRAVVKRSEWADYLKGAGKDVTYPVRGGLGENLAVAAGAPR